MGTEQRTGCSGGLIVEVCVWGGGGGGDSERKQIGLSSKYIGAGLFMLPYCNDTNGETYPMPGREPAKKSSSLKKKVIQE